MNSMGGAISNGSTTYPTWSFFSAYPAGNKVLSGSNQLAYQCLLPVAAGVGSDPSADAVNWVQIPLPNYQQPVPIPAIRDRREVV